MCTEAAGAGKEFQSLPEKGIERDEGLRILVSLCIKKVDRIAVRGRGKSCAARTREQLRHAR